MKKTESPVRQGLILVCDECERRLESRDHNSASLRKELKHHIKEQGNKREWKAVSVSCLNLCPKGRVAVARVRVDTAAATEFYEIKATEFEAACKELLNRKPPSRRERQTSELS